MTGDDRHALDVVGWNRLTLRVTCRRCDAAATAELVDFVAPVEHVAEWSCPRCNTTNRLPVLARVVSVEKSD